jgi:hypothetical protein
MMNGRLQICRERGSKCCRRLAVRIAVRPMRRACFVTVVCWLFASGSPKALSLTGESVEYPIKLAFLFNFAKFVEWPTDSYRNPGAPLEICIVGHDPFSPDSERELQTRTVAGHPVEVLTVKPTDTLRMCHMVFIPITENDQADKIVRGLNGSSTLTVGEAEGFAVLGGIINLTVEGNKVHFEVNRLAADRAGLKISSRLLSLARIVTERDHRGKS